MRNHMIGKDSMLRFKIRVAYIIDILDKTDYIRCSAYGTMSRCKSHMDCISVVFLLWGPDQCAW